MKKIAKTTGIEKNLSCHIARHSFASIAGNSVNIQILQKLYRHSDLKPLLIIKQTLFIKILTKLWIVL